MSDALVSSQQSAGFDNSFFGGFFNSLGQTLSRTADAVLPVWTAKQLGLQSQDQLGLKGTTFVATPSTQPISYKTQPAFMDLTNVNGGTIIAIVALGAALVLAFKG